MKGTSKDQQRTERRGARRARVNLRTVEFRGDKSYVHPIVHISTTGMLLRDASFTLDRLFEQTDLDLEFGLPGIERKVRVQGRIVRIEPTDDGEPGVVVEFVDLDPRDAEAIEAYVCGVIDGQSAAGRAS